MDAISEILVVRSWPVICSIDFKSCLRVTHSEQTAVGVDYRKKILASWTAIMVNEFLRFLKSSIGRESNDVRTHHFQYEEDLEGIEPVFAAWA